MIRQFNATYRITVYSKDDTVKIEYPITCKFNVARQIFSESCKATFQLYNLAPETRNRIYQDVFQLNPENWKYVRFEAGYNQDALPEVFFGRVMQSFSFKPSPTDVITEIQAVALDIFDRPSSHTFAEGTTFKDAVKTVVSEDMPNVTLGDVGTLEGVFQTPTTFDGNAADVINEITGGHSFVDNGILNILMANEVRYTAVPIISKNTNLLGTPMRRDANLEVKTTFLPEVVVGQLVETDSGVASNFNGQFKLVGFTHDGLFSKSVAGQKTTVMSLWIGPMLPNSNIAVTGATSGITTESGQATGGENTTTVFKQVKNEEVTPVNPAPASTAWIMPCKGAITSPYGNRVHPTQKVIKFHDGIDIGAPLNTKVLATADGEVTKAMWNGGYGKYIELSHTNGLKSFYGHLNSFNVQVGNKVKQGDVIALSGNTAGRDKNGKLMTTGPHLHFGASKNGRPVNPLTYIK